MRREEEAREAKSGKAFSSFRLRLLCKRAWLWRRVFRLLLSMWTICAPRPAGGRARASSGTWISAWTSPLAPKPIASAPWISSRFFCPIFTPVFNWEVTDDWWVQMIDEWWVMSYEFGGSLYWRLEVLEVFFCPLILGTSDFSYRWVMSSDDRSTEAWKSWKFFFSLVLGNSDISLVRRKRE